jgi:hypothetical protein
MLRDKKASQQEQSRKARHSEPGAPPSARLCFCAWGGKQKTPSNFVILSDKKACQQEQFKRPVILSEGRRDDRIEEPAVALRMLFVALYQGMA